MSRYFFHVHDGVDLRDEIGTELPDLGAARAEAVRYASDCLRSTKADFWTGQDWTMQVADKHGLLLFSLTFSAFNAPASGEARLSGKAP